MWPSFLIFRTNISSCYVITRHNFPPSHPPSDSISLLRCMYACVWCVCEFVCVCVWIFLSRTLPHTRTMPHPHVSSLAALASSHGAHTIMTSQHNITFFNTSTSVLLHQMDPIHLAAAVAPLIVPGADIAWKYFLCVIFACVHVRVHACVCDCVCDCVRVCICV